MPLTTEERRALQACCAVNLYGFAEPKPAEEFRLIADWCREHGVAHDHYGEGTLIEAFEARIAALLGKEAAAVFPSGIMAQLAAVRIWTERARLPRFGLHPTSHLIGHEREAYQALFGLHGAVVGSRLRPMTAADLAAEGSPLACLIVELPIRFAGGQLPTWDELAALKAAARERAIPLHMDGARLWESRAFYGRTHAEIAGGFASVYVSLYKGLGGIAGAVLAGDADFVAEARIWRKRLGGTLIRQSPMIASAAMRLDGRLAQMDACYERAQGLAAALGALPGIRVNPPTPHVNMMHVFFSAPAEAVKERRDAIAEREGVWLFGGPEPVDAPGWSATELYVGDTLLGLTDAEVVRWMGALAA